MEKNEKIYCDIFKSFQYFRLKKSVELTNQIIAANTITGEGSFFGFINKMKNNKREKAEAEKNNYESLIQDFEKENENYNFKLYYEHDLEKNIKELFEEDIYNLSKLLFAINIIFDRKYNYKGDEETFKVMSSILYYNSTKFDEIEKQFKRLFMSINKKELSKLQKGILIGLAFASVSSVFCLPVLVAGGAAATASTTTAALAAIGIGDMQLGVGFASMCGAVASLALVGSGYAGMKLINREKLKKEYKNLSLEETAMLLTLKAMIISEAKTTMPKEKFKEEISEILGIVDDYKSDTEYLLFAENNDVNVNIEKMNQFHRWDNELIKLLGL